MNKADESIRYLTLSFENGYTDVSHINTDEDLDNVRNLATFKMLLDKWKPEIEIELQRLTSKKKNNSANNKENMAQKSTTIPLRSKGSGTYEVACKINDLPLNFIFDTGASDISISQTEVQFMLKNNYLKSSDVLGSQKYMDANGNIEIGTKIMLRKVEIGDIELSNVSASVVNNNKAPLLFGQSALSKYGKILIDNEKKTISISK
jgi:Predicted aspartyl protease